MKRTMRITIKKKKVSKKSHNQTKRKRITKNPKKKLRNLNRKTLTAFQTPRTNGSTTQITMKKASTSGAKRVKTMSGITRKIRKLMKGAIQ